MSTARRIKAEYAEKAKIRSKKSGFCAVKRKMRFRQSASELAVHDNALGQYRTIKLRCFAEILRPDFVALSCNTSSIAAKTRLIRTQNLLANHSCSIMRYYLKLRLFRGRSRIGCVLFPFQHCRVSFCAAKHKGGRQRERLFRVERTLQTQSGLGRLNLHVFVG